MDFSIGLFRDQGTPMRKSTFTSEYRVLVRLLKETRIAASFTQVDLAQALGQTQSYVSKVERGELRLDVIQLRHFCEKLNISLPDFVAKLEDGIRGQSKRRRT
jgi:transcriptional regulator with XRE-family HTH domain